MDGQLRKKKDHSLGARDSEIDPIERNSLTVKAIDPTNGLLTRERSSEPSSGMEREALRQSRRRRTPSSGGTRLGGAERRKDSGGRRRPSRVGWGSAEEVEPSKVASCWAT